MTQPSNNKEAGLLCHPSMMIPNLHNITTNQGVVPCYIATPSTSAPYPSVLVIHDAVGMSPDLCRQADWLAEAGYFAVAPDLFHQGHRFSCIFRAMREFIHGNHGPTFDKIHGLRTWLKEQTQCSKKIGIIGFCFGGGFALALAPSGDYDASAVNYGSTGTKTWERLDQSCPIIASYGAEDRSLRGDADRLEQILTQHHVPHEIKVYPGVGHGFMNNHDKEELGWIFRFLGRISNTRFDASATTDARRRILAFFDKHLQTSSDH